MNKNVIIQSFLYAINGITHGFKTQRNLRFHLFATVIVFLFAWLLHVSLIETGILILTCMIVISLELINTAIENVVDICSEKKLLSAAKYAKDISAGAVLISATGAVIIGIIIFLPYMMNLIHYLFQ